MDTIATLFSLLCHQLPERSPQWHEHVFALCWRCSGLYFGVFASYLWLALSGGLRRRMPSIACLIGAGVLMTPFVIDGWANTLGLWDSPGWLRAASGLGYGVVVPLLLVPLANPHPFAADLRPSAGHAGALLAPLAIGAVLLLALIEPASPWAFAAMTLPAFAALVLFVVNFALTLRTRGAPRAWIEA